MIYFLRWNWNVFSYYVHLVDKHSDNLISFGLIGCCCIMETPHKSRNQWKNRSCSPGWWDAKWFNWEGLFCLHCTFNRWRGIQRTSELGAETVVERSIPGGGMGHRVGLRTSDGYIPRELHSGWQHYDKQWGNKEQLSVVTNTNRHIGEKRTCIWTVTLSEHF